MILLSNRPIKAVLVCSAALLILLVLLLYLIAGRSWMTVAEAAIRPSFEDESAFNAIPAGQAGLELHFPFVNSDPDLGWLTTAVIQNAGGGPASLTLRYYDGDGNEVDTVVDSLAPLASRGYTPTGVFSGSLVVESTEPIAAVVDETSLDPGWTADGGMAYTAVSLNQATSSLFIQPILRNYFNLNNFFAVENLSLATAEVTVTFATITGTVVASDTTTLPARSSKWYDARSIAELPDDFIGYALVESVAPLAGVNHIVSEEAGSRAVNTISLSAPLEPAHVPNQEPNLAATGVTTPVEDFQNYLPYLINSSGLELVNLANVTVYFVIDFHDQTGILVFSYLGEVAPGMPSSIYLGNLPLPAGYSGSAVVSSDGPLAVQVSTDWQASLPRTQTMYAAIDVAATQVLVPYARHLADELITQIVVQNAEGLPADVTVTYFDLSGNPVVSDSIVIAPYAVHVFDQGIVELPSPFQGSALVTSSNLVAVVGFASHKRPLLDGSIAGVVLMQGRSDHGGAEVCAFEGGNVVQCDLSDSGGFYELVLPAGSYDVTVEMSRYLDGERNSVSVVAGSTTTLPGLTLKGGDSNDDDIINILDLSFMGARYLLGCGDPGYDARADINDDCIVNILDIAVAGGNYLLTSPVDWP